MDEHKGASSAHNSAHGSGSASKRRLARMLALGTGGVSQDTERAIRMLEELIDADGLPDDMCELALIMRADIGDIAHARALYERAIAAEPAGDAAVQLALLQRDDEDRSLQLLMQCFLDGDDGADAARNVSRAACVARDRLPDIDVSAELDLLERAAVASGRPSAMRVLAHEMHGEENELPNGALRALRLYEKASSLGDADASRARARLLLDGGAGVDRDPARACALLESLVSTHRASADHFALAALLQAGAGDAVAADPARAAMHYQCAVDLDDSFQSAINLALMLGRGDAIARDEARAAALLFVAVGDGADAEANVHTVFWDVSNETAANADDLRLTGRLLEMAAERSQSARILVGLARVLETGDAHMPIDVGKAAELYERAGDEPGALRSLARLLARGSGTVVPDLTRAGRLLGRAVALEERGDDMVALAKLLRRGAGGPPDGARAATLYERAVEGEGHYEAMVQLAFMLGAGKEVARDEVRARTLMDVAISSDEDQEEAVRRVLELAGGQTFTENGVGDAMKLVTCVVEEGLPGAMRTLAGVYVSGEYGVGRDARVAARLYSAAAERHRDADSMRRLAALLRQGAPGVAVDKQRAAVLLRQVLEIEESARDIIELAGLLRSSDEMEARALYVRALEVHASFEAGTRLAFILNEDGESGRAADILDNVLHEEGLEGYNVEEAFGVASGKEDIVVDSVRALALLSRVVDQRGNVSALANLGAMLEKGQGAIGADITRAVQLYELAVAKGDDPEALHNLAVILRDGRGNVKIDRPRAVRLLTRSVDAFERPEDMCELAGLLRSDRNGVPADPSRAEQLYRRAALIDENKRAIVHLAFMMERGIETKADTDTALALLRAALRSADGPYYAVQQAFAILNGYEDPDVPIHAYRALALLLRAVDLDDAGGASRALATMLEHGGARIAPDAPHAAALYATAADERGDVESMRRLAGLLARGAPGVEPDSERAEELLRAAVAADGDGDDMCQLAGLLRRRGEGEEAVRLYERAMTCGDREEAATQLAYMLASDEEVERDEERARRLLTITVEEGAGVGEMYALTRSEFLPVDGESARGLLVAVVEESGDTAAMRKLGGMMARDGVDPRSVLSLYRCAVKGGDVDAMVELAEVLELGVGGVQKDMEEASTLYKKAVARGEGKLKRVVATDSA